MNEKRSKILSDAMAHSRKATELFRLSLEVHHEEMSGELSRDEAVERAVTLNDQAITESQTAIQLMNELNIKP